MGSGKTLTGVTIILNSYYKTKLGKLYNGDCVDVSKNFKSASFDLVIADPPYSMPSLSAFTGKKGALSKWPDLMNYSHFLSAWMTECQRILTDDGAMWVFCNWKSFPALYKAAFDIGNKVESLLVWDKNLLGLGGKKGLRTGYEMVALVVNPQFVIKNRSLKDIQKFNWVSTKPTGHPAEKPVSLIKWLIEISSAECVCDFFMGSGTTAMACEELGKPWTGIEMNDQFCELSKERLNTFLQVKR